MVRVFLRGTEKQKKRFLSSNIAYLSVSLDYEIESIYNHLFLVKGVCWILSLGLFHSTLCSVF